MVRSKSISSKQRSQQQSQQQVNDEEANPPNIADDVTSQQQSQQVNDEEEANLNIPDDVTSQQQSQQQDKHRSIPIMKKIRKKRGINKIKDLPAGESVRFNKDGAAIGEYQRTFTSYCGNSVRKNISILYPNWHKVDVEDKDLLWLDIKQKMRLEDDDDIKTHTLKSCGQKWRAYKNKLRNEYMLLKRSPFVTYTFLNEKVYEEFCRIERYTEEKLKIREEARARALNQTNRPRVGAKGFAGFEEQWEEERNDPNRATDLHKIPGRGSNFCLGRRQFDKDGNLIVPPETADIAKKLVETSKQLSQGTIEAQPGADALTIVYGPDHGGRTRGVSSIVGRKKGLTGYVRKKRTYNEPLDFEELSEKVQEKLFSGPVWNRLKDKMLEELRKDPSAETSSVGPTTRKIRIDGIQETTTCSLFSPESIFTGEKILCAHAMVYPVGDGMIHGKRLRKGHMKVSISKVLNRQEDLELPVPDEEIPNLGGALEAFIQWPIGAIAFFKGPNTPETSAAAKSTLPKKLQGPATQCSEVAIVPAIITQASKKRKKTTKAPIEQSNDKMEKANIRKRLNLLKDDIDARSDAVKKGYQWWMDHEDCTMPQLVYFKKEIFRDADDFTLPINPIDIIELLNFNKIGTNIITMFSRSLYLHTGTSRNNKTGFLNPEVITADAHMDTDIEVGIYLTRALNGYEFFVAPYLHDGHHVLLIICPNQERGFILDSVKWEPRKTKKDYHLVKQVERVVGHLSWEFPTVNVQEDDVECGFYVMKWMLDFVLKYQHDDFPNIVPWGDARPLSLKETDASVNAWFSLWRDRD